MEQNELYPIFLKVNQLNILIIGGGNVGYEKLSFLLKSSPNAKVEVISSQFSDDTLALCSKFNIPTLQADYHESQLTNRHLVIAATNNKLTNTGIYHDAKKRNLLTNVADTPELCDFYLGGVVTKGQIKIAISTNGKSPTLAKRIRQFLEEILPDDTSKLAENLNKIRNDLKLNFQQKVEKLNDITKGLISKEETK